MAAKVGFADGKWYVSMSPRLGTLKYFSALLVEIMRPSSL
jgi:hypothetical protein